MAARRGAGKLNQRLSKKRIIVGVIALYAVLLQAFVVSAFIRGIVRGVFVLGILGICELDGPFRDALP